jgi:hypothetical protein
MTSVHRREKLKRKKGKKEEERKGGGGGGREATTSGAEPFEGKGLAEEHGWAEAGVGLWTRVGTEAPVALGSCESHC